MTSKSTNSTHLHASKCYKKITSKYGLDGSVSPENLKYLSSRYCGAIYLCKERSANPSAQDKCSLGGFDDFSSNFQYAAFTPLDPSLPEYQVNCSTACPREALLAYKRFESALDSSPRPTVLVCASSTRASAVYAAYKGVKENLTKEEIFEYANENGLKFVNSPGLSAWVSTVLDQLSNKNRLLFRQLFDPESSTYTYLLADDLTKEAVLIDPVLEMVNRDAALIQDLGLKLKYVLNTHVHADHVTGSGKLKELHPGCQSIISAASGATVADIKLTCTATTTAVAGTDDNNTIYFGSRSLRAVATPGHTEGCVSYILDDLSRVFTGDALLIRGCGRTDFQGGSSVSLYRSIHTQLYAQLPADCIVQPAHDYQGRLQSTIGEEIRFNPRLTKSQEEFISIMANLNLPKPDKIDIAVPANRICGI